MKIFFILSFCVITNVCSGQVSDDFADGDFSSNPTWSGDTTHFIINGSHQLQLSNVVAGTSSLSTPWQVPPDGIVEWNVFIRQAFAPSGANYGRIYLMSSEADLGEPLNGYYLQLGEAGSNDAVELFRQTGTLSTSVCRGANGAIATSFSIRLHISRDTAGLWTLKADYTGGTSFADPVSGTDTTFSAGSFMGVFCMYTASNANRFFFDDVYAGTPPGDTTAPSPLSINASSGSELLVQFSEPLSGSSAQSTLNYWVNNSVGNPATAVLLEDSVTVRLTFPTSFINGKLNVLTIRDVSDRSKNALDSASLPFRYFVPQPADENDLVLNEFFPDPSPQIGMPAGEFVEIYNKSDKAFDLAGWSLSDLTTSATLPAFIILPAEYVLITGSTHAIDYSAFGPTISLVNFPTLNNAGDVVMLTGPTGEVIDSVNYALEWYKDEDKSQGGFTLERLNPAGHTNDVKNWLASVATAGGTPAAQNSVFGWSPDRQPPEIIQVVAIASNEVDIRFNEAIEPSTAVDVTQYFVSGKGNPTGVRCSSDSTVVTLFFESEFENGVEYQISVEGQRDPAGNSALPFEGTFMHFVPSEVYPKDVIISEIMADPSPPLGLPEAEYIEIYNRSGRALDMANWKLGDSRQESSFPPGILLPGKFLVLASAVNAPKFGLMENVAGLSNFPSLSNDGEMLVLKDGAGLTIDSLTYSSAWYRNREKQEGGWSLELIDPANPCGEGDNWAAAEDDRGGTPGNTNSVFASKPDVKGPEIISLLAESEWFLRIEFNEKLQRSLPHATFTTTPPVAIAGHSFEGHSLRTLRLALGAQLEPGVLYRFQATGISDCAGNYMEMPPRTFEFALPQEAEEGDVIINEVLFNPLPNGADFIEIYNGTPKFISMRDWKLGNLAGDSGVNAKRVSGEEMLLHPYSYLVFTADRVAIGTSYPNAAEENLFQTELPAMPDDEGSVLLLRGDGAMLDQLTYDEGFHSPYLREREGVSLERISTEAPGQDRSNWRSANGSAGYATPGLVNSNSRPDLLVEDGEVEISPEIFSLGSSDSFAAIKYRFDEGGQLASVRIYDPDAHLIREIASNESVGLEGFFRWDGDRQDGSKARSGCYIVWVQVFDPGGRVRNFLKRVVIVR